MEEMTKLYSLSVVKFLKISFPADFPTAVLTLPQMIFGFHSLGRLNMATRDLEDLTGKTSYNLWWLLSLQ